MHNDGQIEPSRQFHLPAKNRSLGVPRRIVVVIVESRLPYCYNLAMGRQPFHELKMALLDLRGIVGMHADAGTNPVVSFGDGDAASHIIGACAVADGQNSMNSRFTGSLN